MTLFRHLSVLMSVGIALVLSGCKGATVPAGATTQAATTGDVEVEPHYAGYEWVRPKADRERLVAVLASIPLGTSYEDVIATAGKPARECPGGTKDLLPRYHRHWFIAYDIAIFRKGSVFDIDQRTTLWFDAAGRLEIVDGGHPDVPVRQTADASEDGPRFGWWKPWGRPTTFPARTKAK
jgi:hypothetical protein